MKELILYLEKSYPLLKLMRALVFACALFWLSSCEDFLKIDPPRTQIVNASVYTNDATAKSAVSGIYSRLMQSSGIGRDNITIFGGLLSDEFNNYNTSIVEREQINDNALNALNTEIEALWASAFEFIYHANVVLEGLADSNGVSETIKNQLEGECKFIRAFCYFYIVNLWGDVPLIVSSDYRVNSVIARSPKEKIYQQIIEDLIDAQMNLSDDYSFSSNERVRPNKWAATALLARTYLYSGDWINADLQATSIINNVTTYSLVKNLNNVFLKNSTEAIWQIRPVLPAPTNTTEGSIFIITSTPKSVDLITDFLKVFESGDSRYTAWVGSYKNGNQVFYYPFKYKIGDGSNIPLTEYYMVFRLAEQYLIRAEARAQQGNIEGSQADLNVIRNRAGLLNSAALTQAELFAAIEQERRIELFAEWGHRWFDLKRWDNATAVLGQIKNDWNETDVLLPIPQFDIDNNQNLSQNFGYN